MFYQSSPICRRLCGYMCSGLWRVLEKNHLHVRRGLSVYRSVEKATSVPCRSAPTSLTSQARCDIPTDRHDFPTVCGAGTLRAVCQLFWARLLHWESTASQDLASDSVSDLSWNDWYSRYYTWLLRILLNASSPRICLNMSSALSAWYTRPFLTSSIASR